MRKVSKIAVALGVLVLVGAAMAPAEASCGNLRIITSLNNFTYNYTYLYTPGISGGYNGSTISPAMAGSFWHIGNGDPTEGLGNDNGTHGALGGFVGSYPGYPAYISSSWAAGGVDGCIDSPVPGGPAARCMAILLTDVDDGGTPVFALITKSADSGANYFVDQAGPITLAALPPARINASTRVDSGRVDVTVRVAAEDLMPAMYLDDTGDCAPAGGGTAHSPVAGVRFVTQNVPRGAQPPSDHDPSQWNDTGVSGLIDTDANLSLTCGGEEDVYVSYVLDLDSGFAASLTGSNSTRVECGANIADPEERIRIRPGQRERTRTRTR